MPIQEEGEVVALEDEGKRMVLAFMRREACAHCMACTIARRKELRVTLPNSVDARLGDWVLVELRQSLLAPALAYGLPLAALFLGLLLGWVLGGETWAAIGALIGAGAGLVSLRLCTPLTKKLRPYPVRVATRRPVDAAK